MRNVNKEVEDDSSERILKPSGDLPTGVLPAEVEDDSSERILKQRSMLFPVGFAFEVEDDSSERILKHPDPLFAHGEVSEVEDDSSERILKLDLNPHQPPLLYRSGRRFFRENTETYSIEDRQTVK